MVLNDNIIAFWNLEESSGNAADEVSSFTGTYQGNLPTQVTGRVGFGQDCDGTGDYISITLDPDANAAFSWSLWVKIDDLSTTSRIIGHGEDAGGGTRYIRINTDGSVDAFIGQGSSSWIHLTAASSTITTGAWFHFVIASDSTGTSKLYINNTEEDSQTQVSYGNASSTFTLGRGAGSGDMSGIIDAVGYWTRQITAVEVTYLFNSGNGIQYPFSLAPAAAFVGLPLSGQLPLSVAFTDQSAETPTSWLWDFGDGNTSTEQNPTKLYLNRGSFTISLIATNAIGSDTETKVDYVNPTPSTIGMRNLKRSYPFESGLTARTQKQEGRVMNLVAENSIVSERKTKGVR
tara:strand:- start:2187 stop:3227 length:1041 start_codon:yes stop_codon:yes gene_type:complete